MSVITLHIVLLAPPAGVDYGLQKGSGSKYETVQKQRGEGKDLHFRLEIEINGDRKIEPSPDFKGPFVQGIRGERFLYIDIGTAAGQHLTQWSRRLKIPLRGISWETIDMLSQTNVYLETRVPGTAKDGGPNCATVKPFAGWTVG